MARKAAAKADRKLQGKTVAFTGKLDKWYPKDARQSVEQARGQVVDDVTETLDYLVVGQQRGAKPSAAETKARKLIQTKGAAIQIIDEDEFDALLAPTREELIALLKGGAKGIAEFQERFQNKPIRLPDLRDADLRNASMSVDEHLDLSKLCLDGADLSGARLRNVNLPNLTGARLDRINLKGGTVWNYQFTRCSFAHADLRQGLNSKVFTECDFTGADLSQADLNRRDLKQSRFTGAKLRGTDFRECCLQGIDLTNADLREAILTGADLSNAIVDGADFTNAQLGGANLTGLDPRRAKGLDPSQAVGKGQVGPRLKELNKVAGKAGRVVTSATLDLNGQPLLLTVDSYGNNHITNQAQLNGKHAYYDDEPKTLTDAMLDLTRRWPQAQLRVESITVSASRSPLKPKEMKALAIAGWCEACGVEVPTEEVLQAKLKAGKASREQLRADLLKALQGGAAGVKAWNARTQSEKKLAGPFRKMDLHDAMLAGVDLSRLDFRGANLAGANLAKCTLGGNQADFSEVSFQGANLSQATLSYTHLGQANFQNANLKGADLTGSNLRGADFSKADLDGVVFHNNWYDEATRFPKGFKPGENLVWKGVGPDPAKVKKLKKVTGPLDIDSFMKRLEQTIDKARLAKALAMLKADRFKLYAQVAEDSVTGVVKSQTDADLVYSCRLTAAGQFGCCTQNLNICGGLRGALCKHLLVLVIGLTRGGELDPTQVDQWANASRQKKPELDKDLMSETFLKFKGAEAGEVDWRPTETIPEDYYAL